MGYKNRLHAYRTCVLSISSKNEYFNSRTTTTTVSTNGSKAAAALNVWRGAVFRTVARKLVRFLACRFGRDSAPHRPNVSTHDHVFDERRPEKGVLFPTPENLSEAAQRRRNTRRNWSRYTMFFFMLGRCVLLYVGNGSCNRNKKKKLHTHA